VDLPPLLRVELLPCTDRYGWRVLRGAYGTDLYGGGRDAWLTLESGGTISAQRHFELAWACARAALETDANAQDLELAERIVAGLAPLGIDNVCRPGSGSTHPVPGPAGCDQNPFGRLIDPIARPGFALHVVAATWDWSLLALSNEDRRRFVVIPRQPRAVS